MSEHNDPDSDRNADANPEVDRDADPDPDADADADQTATHEESTAPDGAGGTTSGGRLRAETPVAYLQWAGIAVLAVTAMVALFGFYTGVSRAISVWVTREYRPLVNAAFNLALLLAALGGIGLLLRRTD